MHAEYSCQQSCTGCSDTDSLHTSTAAAAVLDDLTDRSLQAKPQFDMHSSIDTSPTSQKPNYSNLSYRANIPSKPSFLTIISYSCYYYYYCQKTIHIVLLKYLLDCMPKWQVTLWLFSSATTAASSLLNIIQWNRGTF